jgi:hypothetical protein
MDIFVPKWFGAAILTERRQNSDTTVVIGIL